MVKHIRFYSWFVIQLLVTLLLPLLIIGPVRYLDWPHLAIHLGISIFLWASNLVVFILSLTIWWNVPIKIGHDGITVKGKEVYLWSDVVEISMKKGPPTVEGNLYTIIIIRYSNGKSISFQPNGSIIKSIRKYCSNDTFITKLDKALE